MPSFSKIFSTLLRTVSYLVVMLLAIIVALSLLLVFYVSPRLDQWREPIQQLVQKHSGLPIEFSGLALSWQGINPQLILKDIAFQEAEQPEPTQKLPQASVDELRLFLQPSLTFWKDGLLSVDIRDARLPLLIDAEGDVWVGQYRLPMADVTFTNLPHAEDSGAEELSFIATLSSYLTRDFGQQIDLLRQDDLFGWLSSVSVENLLLTVRDASNLSTGEGLSDIAQQTEESSASVFDFILNFKQAKVQITEKSIKSDAVLQSDMISTEEIVIDNLIDYSQVDEEGELKVSGYLSLKSSFLKPKQLFSKALDTLTIDQVVIEQFDFHAELSNGHWQEFKADLQLADFSMPQAKFERMSFSAEGDVADALAVFVDYGHQHSPIHFDAMINNAWLHETLNFRHEFALDNIVLKGRYELDDANLAVLSIQELEVKDPNVELSGRGKWHALPTGGSGHIQLEGEVHHLVASYLPRFLPTVIDGQALDWLDGAFINGTLHNGRFLIDGLADHYPYGKHPQSGVNKIMADFKAFSLDFDHQTEGIKWPVLQMEQGTFRFINDEILIDANRGWMDNLAGEESIYFDDLHATISALEADAMLEIDANADTTAEKFLLLMQETPLSALLSHALDDSEASGNLRASLEIAIPLNDMNASTINGHLYTDDGEFRLNPSFPQATDISGSLSFNEKYLTINKLNSKFVGGPAEVSGDIARPGHSLNIKGQFSGAGIYDYYPLKGLQQIQGLAPYELDIKFLESDTFEGELRSNLVGLSINYPSLYNKSAKTNVPLRVQWQRQRRAGGAYGDQIAVNYEEGAAQFKAEFNSGDNQELLFKRGAVAFKEEPLLPEQGLFFHGAVDKLDVESLTHWIDNFGFTGDGSNQLINGFDVRAKELLLGGVELAEVGLKSRLDSFKTIPLTLSGPTVEGSLVLTESTKAIGSYDVKADFNHLHWRVDQEGDDLYADESDKTKKEIVKSMAETPWVINHLGLKVQDLRIYNYHLENVEVLGQAEDSQTWRLDKLAIQDESGHLYGAAYLRNKNDKLSADLNFNINTLDVDGLLNALSVGDDLLTGHGDIQGGLLVHDLLNFEPDDLEINVLGVLRDGYINNVGTGATRLLALLSLQALSKLPDMNKIFTNQGTNSMNYSYLRFHLGLKKGHLWLPDFRLDSPLIGLAAQGQGNLRTEAIDLDVVAVPRLDMSGAAVLTGVIINPAVGVAAFLSQWLLRSPMESGLTQRFAVGGTLDDIEIDGVAIDMNKVVEPSDYVQPQQQQEFPSVEELAEPRTIIDTPEGMIDLAPEVQIKTPAPIIIEQGLGVLTETAS